MINIGGNDNQGQGIWIGSLFPILNTVVGIYTWTEYACYLEFDWQITKIDEVW